MPSFDAAYCKIVQYDMAHDHGFTPEQSVESVSFSPVKGSDELAVIVPPWHAPEWYLRQHARAQNRLGRSALTLSLNDHILSADPYRTIESFGYIADMYEAAVSEIGQEPTHWQATSLGTSILMHTVGTKGLPAPSIAFVAPGGDLARSLWTGLRTQPLRRQLEANGMSEEALVELWKPLSPIEQASAIKESNVEMNISFADEVIRPDTAFTFAAALSLQNRVSVFVNRHFGHYGTILHHTFLTRMISKSNIGNSYEHNR